MKWPESQGASLDFLPFVVSAREFGEEPFADNALCPLEPLRYGIESISGIFKRLSSSRGRPIVRFNTSPLNKANTIPKPKPPPANPRAILSRIFVSGDGGEGF